MALDEFVAAWNARDPQLLAARYTADGVRHQFALAEARLVGREAIAQGIGVILHAVPDATLEVRSESAADDGSVTLEWTFRGTLVNDIPGLPANGGAVHLPGVSVCRMDGDLIREERVYWDTATLMAAAGLLGPPAEASAP